MAIVTAFQWLGETAPGQFLAASTASFAAVQSAHLLGLAGLGGSAVVADLARLGAIFRRGDPDPVVRGLFPWFLGALAVMVVSGVLLVAAGPMKYLLNPLFGPKLAVLAAAVALHLLVHPFGPRRGPAAKALAAASLLAWIAVAVIGRWVGLI